VTLDLKRLGPFEVLEAIKGSKLAYRLRLPPQMRIRPVFHVSLLEPHRQNSLPGCIQPPPPPGEVEGTLEWEVEDILDSRIRHGKLEYLVHWLGYRPHEHTWEPLAHLKNSAFTIDKFHQRHPNRPSANDLPMRRLNQS